MEPRRRFKFLKELAQGGFGKVYLAEMITGENFSTVVAIKLLHGRWLGNDEIVMRSRDEARLLGKLRHRNIVRVEDLTSINGQCAIVMEYLKGVDLKQVATWLKERGRVFPRKALFEAIGSIATALEAAYAHTPVGASTPLAVIHRDIKPSNAMVTVEGELKVLDFGTARATFEEREAKTQVLSFGSQAYMAPERMLGEPDTPAGDIFSLGITMYELLTLDSYGKIHLREERFGPALGEKVDAIDLSTVPAELQGEIRETLKLMLSYDPLVRPDEIGRAHV
jgi:serine/threonine protein kinase